MNIVKPTIVSESIRASVGLSRVFAVDSQGTVEEQSTTVEYEDYLAARALTIFADMVAEELTGGRQMSAEDVVGLAYATAEAATRGV